MTINSVTLSHSKKNGAPKVTLCGLCYSTEGWGLGRGGGGGSVRWYKSLTQRQNAEWLLNLDPNLLDAQQQKGDDG